MSGNSAEQENLCVVCFKNFEIYSIGVCDHAVCFECSTRMRVLCKQNECPICRGEMQKVIFTRTCQPYNELFAKYERSNLHDRRYGIYFCTSDIQRAYQKLLEHRCWICSKNSNHWPFRTFSQLKDHMRREHELFYCEICVDNLKIFTFERRTYNRQELATHRRKGDKDNTSHRGHPLCEFCDTRYMDNDELFRHLRRNHLFCHFCDADGKYQYYNSIEDLKRHFREEHFLCEENDCKGDPLTSVFRTDIDLKAHIALEHGKNMSKTATKMARTLELEFTLMPRARTLESGKNFKSGRYRGGDPDDEPGGPSSSARNNIPETVTTTTLTPQDFPALGNSSSTIPPPRSTTTTINFTSKVSPSLNSNDFPSLGGSSAPALTITTNSTNNRTNRTPEVTVTRTVRPQQTQSGRLSKTNENFPPLSGPSGSSTVHLSLNSQDSTKPPKLSIHVNHKPNGTISTHITTTNVQQKPTEAFPALGKPSSSNVVENKQQPKWVVASKVKKPEPAKVSKVAPAPQLPPSDLTQFPTLSKSKKSNQSTDPASWINLNSLNNTKPVQQQQQKVEKKTTVTTENGNKTTSKNKKKKNKNTSNNNNNNNEEKSSEEKSTVVKKRSELKIGTLSSSNSEQITKPPPGFNVKPPPGFSSDLSSPNNFPSLSNQSNDLTFTNSSGQSYAITPTTKYRQPTNFAQRNQQLIKKLMQFMHNNNEAIIEFKKWSDAFRNGTFPANEYYNYCKSALKTNFDEIFVELLVLLPDIEKQQQLFKVYDSKLKSQQLVICENCKQVILKRELTDHYNYHTLDNHFPSLGKATQVNNVWKK